MPIGDRLDRAKNAFLLSERQLLELDADERTLTAAFAHYVRAEFPMWRVDCEYNRRVTRTKKLRWRHPKIADRVRPDIIVHRRNTQHNLLVIEAKKSTQSKANDRKKLSAFKADPDYQYVHAVLLTFVVGPKPDVTIEEI